MIVKLIGICFLVSLLVSCIGCSGSSNHNASKPTRFPDSRDLYVSKCSACHKTYERELHTAIEWRKILDEMGNKAKLTNYEKEKILNYLSERN